MKNPTWLTDLQKAADGMPFGEMEVRVTRHRSKTSKVIFSKDSKLLPKSNPEAFNDLEKLINSLISAGFDGELQFALSFKSGTIELITIKNKEVKNYGQS